MSLIAIGLNLMLAGLLVAALIYGRRLDGRLKAVRDGQQAFARAVAELDVATSRARMGLDELRAAADESTDLLGGRVTRAREAAERLERLIQRAEAVPEPAPVAATSAIPAGGLAALIAELNAAAGEGPTALPRRQDRTDRSDRARQRPVRPTIDEELFA